MKLPGPIEKFIVIDEKSGILNRVVIGVHVEIRPSGLEDDPDRLVYFLCADNVLGSSLEHMVITCDFTLEGVLARFSQCLLPYQEPESEAQPALCGGCSGKGGSYGQ